MKKNKIIVKAPWQPIDTFKDGTLGVVSDGYHKSTEDIEVVKYELDIPVWANFWMPLPGVPTTPEDIGPELELEHLLAFGWIGNDPHR